MFTPPSPTSPWNTRAAVVAACVVAFCLTCALVCGGNAAVMLSVAATDGVAGALWVLGATALGAVVLRLVHVRANALLFIATAGGMGLGLFSLAGLGLGLLGALNRPVALAMPLVSCGLFAVDVARRGGVRKWSAADVLRWFSQPAGTAWVWLVPVVSLTMAVVAACVLPAMLWRPLDPHPYDVTSYHLQVPREWYEAGRIVPLDHNMFSYFPMNVEVQYLLLMHAMAGPWQAMYACQFVSVGYTVLMLLAIAGAASPPAVAGRPGDAGVVATAVVSAVPWVVMLAGVAYVEAGLMLYTALAVAWAMRAVAARVPEGLEAGASNEPNFLAALVLAGAMAGFACGVKITAVPMLLLALPVGVAAAGWKLVPRRRLLIGCAACVAAGSVVVAPWLLRNLVWAHNPLWPVGISVLGRDHFSPGQVERFRIAHSPLPGQRPIGARLALLWRDVLAHWEYGYVLFPAAIGAMAVRWRDRQVRVLVVSAAFVFVVWIGFTHLLPRFLVMLVPIGGMSLARVRWGRAWPAGILLALGAGVIGVVNVGPLLSEQVAPADRAGVFGLTDVTKLVEPELTSAVAPADVQVGLIGDAQPFLFDVPMNRLHYRTVFDLPANEPDPTVAWVGSSAVNNPHWVLVVNPSEIARLHGTYRDTPALPAAWDEPGRRTFLMRGDGVRIPMGP